jgi:hypothetical protein
VRIEIGIEKYTVAAAARHVLQRQRDEIAKAAFGHPRESAHRRKVQRLGLFKGGRTPQPGRLGSK